MMSYQRIPQAPPVIDPLPTNIDRPFWSIMIPSYNCISFLRFTILSVIQANIYENAQIEVVDDCSTDGDVENLVKEIGNGKIGFYRQEVNVGSLRNFETCIRRAKGVWIHILHGDDLIAPDFYLHMKYLVSENQNVGAAFCRNVYINEDGKELFLSDKIQPVPGIIENWLFKIAEKQKVEPPSIVVKRSVYEKLGSFYGIEYGEDWLMWVRIAAQFPVAYSPEALAYYRDRSNNISEKSILSGKNIDDFEKSIQIIKALLPKNHQHKLMTRAKMHYSKFLAGKSYWYFKNEKYRKSAIKQSIRAFQLHKNKTTLKCFLWLTMRNILAKLKIR